MLLELSQLLLDVSNYNILKGNVFIFKEDNYVTICGPHSKGNTFKVNRFGIFFFFFFFFFVVLWEMGPVLSPNTTKQVLP